MLTEPIAVTLTVVDIFEALHVPYFIGGSLAGAVHGVVRATMDVDLIADMRPEHVESFVKALKPAFYVDDQMILDAIDQRGSFNLVHLETMFKVDVFIRKENAFEQSQFERRASQVISTQPERAAYVATPEDLILAKLQWHRLGGEASDRQWNDVLNILKVQGERLDKAYLGRWAEQLKITDLLQRAFQETQA